YVIASMMQYHFGLVDNKRGQEIWQFIQELKNPADQVRILSAPGAIPALADAGVEERTGYGQEIWQLIQQQENSVDQIAMLSAPGAIPTLMAENHGQEVIQLIRKMPDTAEQVRILSIDNTVAALMEYGNLTDK